MEKVLNMTVDRAGVDEASETAGRWLESTGIGSRDIVRIRLAVEEILKRIGKADEVYVSPEKNKAYWVRGNEKGDIDLWD